MKKPSKNISASLRGQSPNAKAPVSATMGRLKSGGVSMTVPGEGNTEAPPGRAMQDRSASRYADASGTKFRAK